MNFEKPKKSEFCKNETKKKKKKIAGDIIILHMCTKDFNHMRYSSWVTKNEKMKTSKKAPGDTIILHNFTKNNRHWLYCS